MGPTAGGGGPVLFLHGQPGSSRDWEQVIAALDGRLDTLAIDRPGWDDGPAGDLQHNADAAVRALDAAGAERATVVGLSFGGAVAAWLAVVAPQRVGALVLVSPAANQASLEPIDRLLAAPVAGYIASAALLTGAALALASRRIRRHFTSAYSFPDDYLAAASRRFRSRAAWDAFVIEQRTLLQDLPALEPRLEEISVPTTVVIGTADTIVPVRAGRRLSEQIREAELVEIEGGHHVLSVEHPQRLAELIVATAARAADGAGAPERRPHLPR